MFSKIHHTALDGCHHTRHGVSCGAVANILAFESILLVGEAETDEGGLGTCMGCGCGV